MPRIQPSSMHARDFQSYDPWDVALGGDCGPQDGNHAGRNSWGENEWDRDGKPNRERWRERGWHEVPTQALHVER